MDEIILRMTKESTKTGGGIPDVAHHVSFMKKLIEGAVGRGQLPGTKVVGYEMRSLDEMEPSKPRMDATA